MRRVLRKRGLHRVGHGGETTTRRATPSRGDAALRGLRGPRRLRVESGRLLAAALGSRRAGTHVCRILHRVPVDLQLVGVGRSAQPVAGEVGRRAIRCRGRLGVVEDGTHRRALCEVRRFEARVRAFSLSPRRAGRHAMDTAARNHARRKGHDHVSLYRGILRRTRHRKRSQSLARPRRVVRGETVVRYTARLSGGPPRRAALHHSGQRARDQPLVGAAGLLGTRSPTLDGGLGLRGVVLGAGVRCARTTSSRSGTRARIRPAG